MAQTKIKSGLIDGGLGIDWQSTIQTSDFTAEAGKGYFVNTTSNEITVSLPVGVVGSEILFQDYAGTFATNKIIFQANGSEKIQGSADDYRCIIDNATVSIVYQDTTKGWTADNIVVDTLPPLVISYLVIAGGGGGGGSHISYTAGGGGGAGGFRNSFAGDLTGGGGSAETTLTLSAATNYTVTIGAGGAAAPAGLGRLGMPQHSAHRSRYQQDGRIQQLASKSALPRGCSAFGRRAAAAK